MSGSATELQKQCPQQTFVATLAKASLLPPLSSDVAVGPGHCDFTDDTGLDPRSSGTFDPGKPDTSAAMLTASWITSASACSCYQLPRLKSCVGVSPAFTQLQARLEFWLLC